MKLDIYTLMEEAKSLDQQESEQARSTLISLGPQCIGPLIEMMAGASKRDLWIILSIFSAIGDNQAVPAVIQCLKRPENIIQIAAIQCLKQLPDYRAVFPLIDLINETEEANIHIWAASTLGAIGDPNAISTLVNLMHATDSPASRYTSIKALEEIGDPTVIEHIRYYLDDSNHHVRSYARNALKKLGAVRL